jgi:hypothetical protein
MPKRFTCLIFSIFLLNFSVYADVPLTIEELLTAYQRWRIDTAFNYSVGTHKNILSENGFIQIGDNAFPVVVPVTEKITQQRLQATLGLRYGITSKTELSVKGSAFRIWTRTEKEGTSTEKREFQFSDMRIGINQRLKKEGKYPAVLTFIETALIQKFGFPSDSTTLNYQDVHFKSWLIGFLFYQTIDPIVLSLNTGYRLELDRTHHDSEVSPGNTFFIQPAINFAVNSDLTLIWGLQWQQRADSKVNGVSQGAQESQMAFQFGAGYAFRQNIIFNLLSDMNISGVPDSSIDFKMTIKL